MAPNWNIMRFIKAIPVSRAAASGPNQPATTKTPLDLYAQVIEAKDGIEVLAQWQDKPLADTEVHLYNREGEEKASVKTDAQGESAFTEAQVSIGLNAIMLGHVVKDQPGKLGEQEFKSASHYATVTFQPSSQPKQASSMPSNRYPSSTDHCRNR